MLNNPSPPENQAAPEVALRAQLAALRARYDSGAVSPGVWAVVRAIEVEPGWMAHERARS